MHEAAAMDIAELLKRVDSSASGLSDEVAAERLETCGLNQVAQEAKHTWLGGYGSPCAIRW